MNGRSVLEPEWSPWWAWVKSLPLALGIPVVMWVVLITGLSLPEGGDLVRGFVASWIYLMFAVPVHVGAYAAVGLPVFLLGGLPDCRWIWRLPTAFILGFFAGVVPPLAIVTFIYKADVFSSDIWFFVGILGTYGLVTAFAARRQRPPDRRRSMAKILP